MLARVLLVALVLFAGATHAKNLYVNNSGTPACSDATTYANNDASNPWCTIARSAWGSTSYASPSTSQAAQAGDVVLVTAGTYWENGTTSGDRFTVSLNPANSGTSGNPITFRGVGLVYVRLNNTYRGAMIGCNTRDYIIWDKFQIDDYYGGSLSDTGPVVFNTSNYCQLINSDVKGHPGTYYHGYTTFTGNYRGVSLEPAFFTTIRNNVIWQFTGGQNEAGVMAYDSSDNIIENNTIHSSGAGVFIKGTHTPAVQERNIIRKNLIYGFTSAGIRVLGSTDAKIYQNVVKNSSGSDGVGLWAGFTESTRSQFVNNTVYNVSRGTAAQGTELVDVVFQNNIVVSSASAAMYNWTVADPTGQDVVYDRNVYYGNNAVWFSEGGGSLTFAQLQALGFETNGSTANPQFVNAAGGDFKLAAESAARTVGVDILDLDGDSNTTETIPAGAYITGSETIGAGALLPGPGRPRWRPASWWEGFLYARVLH